MKVAAASFPFAEDGFLHSTNAYWAREDPACLKGASSLRVGVWSLNSGVVARELQAGT